MSKELLPTNTFCFYKNFIECSNLKQLDILDFKMFSEGVFYQIIIGGEGCESCDIGTSGNACTGRCSDISDLVGWRDWTFRECDIQDG